MGILFSKKKSKQNKINNGEKYIDCSKITVLDLYDVNVIQMEQFWNIVQSENDNVQHIMQKIKDIMVDISNRMGFNSYIVPNPRSENGSYWSDYPFDFIRQKYGNDDIGKFFVFIVYINDGVIDLNKNIIIDGFELDKKQKKMICDLFWAHLPYNFEWSGENIETMKIKYDKNDTKFEIPQFHDDDQHPYVLLMIKHNYDKFIWYKDDVLKPIVNYVNNGNIKFHYSCGIEMCEFELYRFLNYKDEIDGFNEILDKLVNDNNEITSYNYSIFTDEMTEVYTKTYGDRNRNINDK